MRQIDTMTCAGIMMKNNFQFLVILSDNVNYFFDDVIFLFVFYFYSILEHLKINEHYQKRCDIEDDDYIVIPFKMLPLAVEIGLNR
jgi:hypothetical protein